MRFLQKKAHCRYQPHEGSQQHNRALAAELDRIFTGKTSFVTLDRLLARLHANKAESLYKFDRPKTARRAPRILLPSI